MRDIKLVKGEFYHVYNRGVDKRIIFQHRKDLDRFLESIEAFNTKENIGNLDRHSNKRKEGKLVDFIAYCINPNHFHFIITPSVSGGLEKFMHKLCMGYSKYFNAKYQRSGALFQGKFKATHIDSDEYLLHLSAYVNLNNEVHKHPGRSVSSWEEYRSDHVEGICNKDIVLDQFRNRDEYIKFAQETLRDIIKRKSSLRDVEMELLTPSVNMRSLK